MIEESKEFKGFSNMITMLKRHEGYRKHPYKCTANKLTIGYGRNLEDVGISQEEAEILLMFDIGRVVDDLNSVSSLNSKLNQARTEVCIMMIFNLGLNGFLKFKKMIKAIEEQNFGKAADEMLDSKWANQVGNRANELAEIMRKGEY